MHDLSPLFDAFDLRLGSVSYDYRRQRMEAQITFTLPLDRYRDPEHDDLAYSFDDHEDEDWEIEVLDIDQGTLAWFSFIIEAKTPAACRYLQERIAPATFWFNKD